MKDYIPRFLRHNFAEAHWIFLVLALLFGAWLILLVPPLRGTDENAHYGRVYQLSTGHLRAVKLADGSFGGQIPTNAHVLEAYMNLEIHGNENIFSPGTGANQQHAVKNRSMYDKLSSSRDATAMSPLSFPATAAYSPVAYVGPLAGVTTGRLLNLSLGHIIFLGRLAALLVYCALVYGALYLLRDKKCKWLVFVVALLPNCLIQAAIISADAQLFGLSLLLFALLMRLHSKKGLVSPRWLIALAVIAVLLPVTKPVYYPLILLVALLPSHLWSSKTRGWLCKLAIVALSTVMLLGWTYATRNVTQAVALLEGPAIATQVDTQGQVSHILHHTRAFAGAIERTVFANDAFFSTGMVGALGWNIALIPAWVAVTALGLLLIAAFYKDEKVITPANLHFRLLAGALGLITIFCLFATFYISYTPVASPVVFGMQGRYFIPVVPFIVYGFLSLLPITTVMRKNVPPILFGTGIALVLLASVLFYHRALY